jgi:hypothetical protein
MKASADRRADERMQHQGAQRAGARGQAGQPRRAAQRASEPDFSGAKPPGAGMGSAASAAAQGSGSDGR